MDLLQVYFEALQDLGGRSRAFLRDAEQDVLRADVFVPVALRDLVCELHRFAGGIGKSFVHSVLAAQSLNGHE